jgi:hypothetical protein
MFSMVKFAKAIVQALEQSTAKNPETSEMFLAQRVGASTWAH